MTSADKPFVVEGYLNLVSQEGGYVDPGWDIDGASLSDKIAEYFGAKTIRWDDPSWHTAPYTPGDIPIGKVRITIERTSGE